MENALRVLDLFSGIGGFSLGLQRAGMVIVGQCEIDAFCRAVLAKHWPGVWRHEDIRTLTGELVRANCGRIDVVCGGFPCQDISTAGKGDGIGGARSGLYRELIRVVREVGPDWVIVENVPALRSRGADAVLADLEAAGYAARALVVGAWAVGAPHKRDRVWIVANRRRGPGDTGAERTGWGEGSDVDRRGAGTDVANGDGVRQLQPGGGKSAVGRRTDNGNLEAMAVPECGPGGREGRARDEAMLAHGETGGRAQDDGGPQNGGAIELAHAAGGGFRTDGGAWDGDGHIDQSRERERERERERVLDDAASERLQGQWADPGPSEITECRDAGASMRWPSGPGQAQYPWEAARLVKFQMGQFSDGLSAGLVRAIAGVRGGTDGEAEEWYRRNKVKIDRRQNREALKAYGNALVPQIPEIIGRWIMSVER